MRSALSRALETLCGGKPPLETRLPSPVLPMPQVQCQQGHDVCSAGFHHDLPSHHLQVGTFSSNRSDPAPVQPGCCRPRLLGEPNSCQVCLQELREHSDAGKPRQHTLINMLNACLLDACRVNEDKTADIRVRLTSQCFSCSRGTTFPKHRWGKARTGLLRSFHA